MKEECITSTKLYIMFLDTQSHSVELISTHYYVFYLP